MRFYLGTHMPSWLERVAVPLFVSHVRLTNRCEPWVLAKSRLASTVAAAQAWTVNNYLELRATDPALPFVPVLQGQTVLMTFRRTRHLMARLDAGDFTVPDHGIERYERHGCRCDVCEEAHQRVARLTARLDDEMRHPGDRYPQGVVAPVDSVHAAELDAMDASDWAEVERWQP